jgi:hypothetical protein
LDRFATVENFGGIDADTDDLLRDCFENHPAYVQALKHRKYIVVGRKGSGKTAIFRKIISDKQYNRFSYGYTFNDYPWAHHDLQAQAGVPEELRYYSSWKYLLLVSLTNVILNQDHSVPWSEECADLTGLLEDFVIDSYGSRNPDFTQLFSPSKEIRLKGKVKAPFAEITSERIRVKDLPVHFQEVNRRIEEYVLGALNPDHDYYLCFDQLDREFDPADPKYKQRLIGLILAARDLSQAARSTERKMSVLVFLRDDIYQLLKFEDKNKITENNLAEIKWEVSGGQFTLKRLMEKRFSQVLGGGDAVAWDEVFDETKEMPSRQTKYNHICDRTFLRPRDMIKFCNEVLTAHRSSSDASTTLMSNPDVHSARDPYSDYLLRELDDEIVKHVPDYEQCLDAIKSIGLLNFTYKSFDKRWDTHRGENTRTSREMLKELFEFSVIGYYKPGGGGGGSKYVWKYQDPRARFSPEAEIFRVHAGLKEVLDLARQ